MLHAPISPLETLTQALIGGGRAPFRFWVGAGGVLGKSRSFPLLTLLSGRGLDTLTGHKWQLPLSSTIFHPRTLPNCCAGKITDKCFIIYHALVFHA